MPRRVHTLIRLSTYTLLEDQIILWEIRPLSVGRSGSHPDIRDV